jgi:hypothetical protein
VAIVVGLFVDALPSTPLGWTCDKPPLAAHAVPMLVRYASPKQDNNENLAGRTKFDK